MPKSFVVIYNLTESQRAAITAAASGRAELKFLDIGEWDDAIERAEVLLGDIHPPHIERAANLKWVQTCYAGVERLVELAKTRGFTLTNASGAFGEGLSEYLLLYTLAIQKQLPQYLAAQSRHEWVNLGTASSISTSTVTVVGVGDIGGAYARKMKALGATVRGVKRTASAKPDYLDELYTIDELDAALAGTDIVALCLPNTPNTAGILTRERIEALKHGAIILNIGRGGAIDQDALIDALQNKRVFAGLDVTTPEPLPKDSPLWDCENLILTPHVSGFASSPLTGTYVAALIARNITAYLDGKPLESLVDLNLGY
ncbi:MAG: D-2-hydroxyacid dehydrogenase [Oscillospiraceae bacterium]|jgi:phosphoglycerate dehydrogenase-like enzyme|nr:D-2-hydroxyacid dehydrogenase [Oscillospiraceae bacterium]